MKEKDSIDFLKKQNSQLKRTISRLKKELNQTDLIKEDQLISVLMEEESYEPLIELCPLCKSEKLVKYTTPSGRELVICKNCKKYRKVTE